MEQTGQKEKSRINGCIRYMGTFRSKHWRLGYHGYLRNSTFVTREKGEGDTNALPLAKAT